MLTRVPDSLTDGRRVIGDSLIWNVGLYSALMWGWVGREDSIDISWGEFLPMHPLLIIQYWVELPLSICQVLRSKHLRCLRLNDASIGTSLLYGKVFLVHFCMHYFCWLCLKFSLKTSFIRSCVSFFWKLEWILSASSWKDFICLCDPWSAGFFSFLSWRLAVTRE